MEDKILIVGFGFIGGYLAPCYQALLGQAGPDNVFAIKGTPRNLEELRKRWPYTISVLDTAAVLEREHPSILVLCPPPDQVPEITREVLAPYFTHCRREGLRLPVLYSFAPTPSAAYFADVLGPDVLAAKILPNVVDRIGEIDMAPIGTNFISLDSRAVWPKPELARLQRFLSPFGENIFLTDEDSLKLLAVKITAHIFYEISYSIADAASRRGVAVTLAQLGSAVRAAWFEQTGDAVPQLCPCGEEGLPEELRGFVRRLTQAWYQGIEDYTAAATYSIPREQARHINALSFELNVLPVQLETREKLHENTRNHGTKGGVLERGCLFFERYMQQPLEQAVDCLLDGKLDADFFDFAQGMSYMITLAALRQSYRLADKK